MNRIENSVIFTVATKKYLSQSILALKSAEKFNSFKLFYIFIVDCSKSELEEISLNFNSSGLNTISLFCTDDLIGNNRTTFQNSFKYFNTFEVCCFAKCIGLVHLKEQYPDLDTCVFVDSDIYFFNSLSNVISNFKNTAIYLTPHTTSKVNDEDEHMYLMQGWINAGFFMINYSHPQTNEILKWLVSRISRRGFFAPEYGLSVDQKWLSLLPMVFPGCVEISVSDGLNVAYWNFKNRELKIVNNVIYSNNTPLVFVHFSGYDTKILPLFSKHSNLVIKENSVLSLICELYNSEKRHDFKISNGNKITFSRHSLILRMRIGFKLFKIKNTFSSEMPGYFGFLGRKIDSIIEKVFKI